MKQNLMKQNPINWQQRKMKQAVRLKLSPIWRSIQGLICPTQSYQTQLRLLADYALLELSVPVAYLKGKAAESQTRTEARIKITENIATQIDQQMKVAPEYARRAVKQIRAKNNSGTGQP